MGGQIHPCELAAFHNLLARYNKTPTNVLPECLLIPPCDLISMKLVRGMIRVQTLWIVALLAALRPHPGKLRLHTCRPLRAINDASLPRGQDDSE
jgi:hypothetical protein